MAKIYDSQDARDTETNGALLLSVLVLLLCLCSFTGILGYRNTAHTNEVPLDSHQAGTAASGIKITSVTYQVTLPTSRRVQFTATAPNPAPLIPLQPFRKTAAANKPPTTPQSIHTVLPHPACRNLLCHAQKPHRHSVTLLPESGGRGQRYAAPVTSTVT